MPGFIDENQKNDENTNYYKNGFDSENEIC